MPEPLQASHLSPSTSPTLPSHPSDKRKAESTDARGRRHEGGDSDSNGLKGEASPLSPKMVSSNPELAAIEAKLRNFWPHDMMVRAPIPLLPWHEI